EQNRPEAGSASVRRTHWPHCGAGRTAAAKEPLPPSLAPATGGLAGVRHIRVMPARRSPHDRERPTGHQSHGDVDARDYTVQRRPHPWTLGFRWNRLRRAAIEIVLT